MSIFNAFFLTILTCSTILDTNQWDGYVTTGVHGYEIAAVISLKYLVLCNKKNRGGPQPVPTFIRKK